MAFEEARALSPLRRNNLAYFSQPNLIVGNVLNSWMYSCIDEALFRGVANRMANAHQPSQSSGLRASYFEGAVLLRRNVNNADHKRLLGATRQACRLPR